jgi:hypothetical protein
VNEAEKKRKSARAEKEKEHRIEIGIEALQQTEKDTLTAAPRHEGHKGAAATIDRKEDGEEASRDACRATGGRRRHTASLHRLISPFPPLVGPATVVGVLGKASISKGAGFHRTSLQSHTAQETFTADEAAWEIWTGR